MTNLEIAEICARSGANCGSLFLDLRFRELVKVGTIDGTEIYLCSIC